VDLFEVVVVVVVVNLLRAVLMVIQLCQVIVMDNMEHMAVSILLEILAMIRHFMVLAPIVALQVAAQVVV
jgi:hypothetical protein